MIPRVIKHKVRTEDLGSCVYPNCKDKASTIHRNRSLCSLHFFVIRRAEHNAFIKKKEEKLNNGRR